MKEDGYFKMIAVTESVGRLLDRLDRRVQAFAAGVRDPVLQEGQDVDKVLPKHSGDSFHRFQPRADRPAIPGFKVLHRPGQRTVSPKRPQTLRT